MVDRVFYFTPPPSNTTSDDIIFVVENQELQIESRYLLPCNYFHRMLGSGMKESFNRRIALQDTSKEAIKTFLSFLKTFQLPSLNTKELGDLYKLAHQYEHIGLLNLLRPQLRQLIPTSLSHIFILGSFYEDNELKKACQDYVEKNPYSEVSKSLMSQIVDAEADKALEVILEWPVKLILEMFTFGENRTKGTPLAKLLQKKEYSNATAMLQVAKGMSVQARSMVSDMSGVLLALLDQENPPDVEQEELILALVADDVNFLTSAPSKKNSPIVSVLDKKWNSLFAKMVNVCSEQVVYTENTNGKSLISIAIANKNIQALTVLIQKNPNLQNYRLTQYILEAIDFQFIQGLKSLTKKKIEKNIVTLQCIEAALQTKNIQIFQIIWPLFSIQEHEARKFQVKVFNENRFDLADIVFPETFDASKEEYELRDTWIYHVVKKGSIQWVEFMGKRCKDKNVSRSDSSSYHSSNKESPLFVALKHKREPLIIFKLLELGFNVDLGEKPFFPIHFIFQYNDASLLKEFLKQGPNLSLLNEQSENFFHLFFKADKNLLDLNDLKVQINRAKKEDFYQKNQEQGDTPLHIALKRKRYTEAFYLFMGKPETLWITNRDKKEPFHCLSEEEFQKMMEVFIKLSLEQKQNQSSCAHLLYWCAENYLYAYCAKLLPGISDIVAVEKNKNTLLHLAASAGVTNTVKDLVKRGIPINCQNNQKKTALHLAVEKINVPMVETLLSLGADIEILNEKQETALSFALKNYSQPRTESMREIIDLLENKSCQVQ